MKLREDNLTIAYVYDNNFESMIFDTMNDYNPKWKGSVSNSSLNLLYLTRSGDKLVSPLIWRLLGDDNKLDLGARIRVGNLLNTMYMKNWDKLWDAMFGDYNPLDNYNMHEEEHTDDVKNERTENDLTDTRNTQSTTTNTGTIKTENDTTDNTQSSDTNNTLNKVYAFNSEEGSNDSSSNSTNTGNTTSTGTDDTLQTNNTSTGYTGTDTLNKDGTVDYTTDNDLDRTMDRHGNIGVTSSQQLIASEIELRKTHFFEIVFEDIDRLLTLPLY